VITFSAGAGRIVGQNPDAKAFRFLLLSVSYGKNATLKNFFSELKRRNVIRMAGLVPLFGAAYITSYGVLKLMPFWDPLRGDPRVERIVASLAPKDAATAAK
jgi:hypothetical protein